jgi:hypothetical protein
MRSFWLASLSLFVFANCGSSGSSISGHAGASGSGPSGAAGTTSTGAAGAGAGGSMATGAAGSKPTGAGGSTSTGAAGMGHAGGTGGVAMCTPGVQEALVTDCGYPSAGGPLSMVTFSEDEVLRAIQPEGAAPNGIVRMFYNDEHALTLGVRSVVVKAAGGATPMDYPVSALAADPSSVTDPQTGTNELAGDQSGLDQSLRPMWPSLYVTDITADAKSRAGDWQQGGRPAAPNAVFGSWKAAVRTVDKTVTPNTVTITPDKDPAKNNWELAGGDPVPQGLTNQGYGAEARWNVKLSPGHSYRVQVIVHDGDQNKAGGDSGEACVLFCAGGSGGEGGGGAGGSAPPPMCPAGSTACGAGGIDPISCPAGTVCANGCCLSIIP